MQPRLIRRLYIPSGQVRLTELRARLGDHVRAVECAGQSFLLTRKGRDVARLVPVDDVIEVLADGTTLGARPLTAGAPGEQMLRGAPDY